MSAIISLNISSVSILSYMITIEAFIEYQNLVLENFNLIINSHIIINDVLTI